MIFLYVRQHKLKRPLFRVRFAGKARCAAEKARASDGGLLAMTFETPAARESEATTAQAVLQFSTLVMSAG